MRLKPFLLLLAILVFASACGTLRPAEAQTPPAEPERTFQQDPTATATQLDTAQIKIPTFKQINPTFTLQVQMMELGDEDKAFSKAVADLDSSIAYANRYFKGYINFKRDPIIYTFDPEGKEIYDLYDDFAGNPAEYDRWTSERLVDTAITVFVMPTGVRDEQILLGFCPVLNSEFFYYEEDQPQFDNLFVTYQGLKSRKTLAHELGHWLGLGHTFSMTADELETFGLTDEEVQRINLMNYVPHPEELTFEQVLFAWKMAVTYRAYRLD